MLSYETPGKLVGTISLYFNPVGLVRRGYFNKIRVYLSAIYLYSRDHPDANREGLIYMGEFESWSGFLITGSFNDLSINYIKNDSL